MFSALMKPETVSYGRVELVAALNGWFYIDDSKGSTLADAFRFGPVPCI